MQNSIFASTRLKFRRQRNNRLESILSFPDSTRTAERRIEKLRMSTVRWARNIPSKIRPRALVIHYPRVANSLAEAWDQPRVFALLINHYLLEKKEGRHSFPDSVVHDLIQLKLHFNALQAASHMNAEDQKDEPFASAYQTDYHSIFMKLAAI